MAKKTLVILRGISGAGKSTFVEKLKKIEPLLIHASADFIHLDREGNYKFDIAKLGEGHGMCFRTAVHAMLDGAEFVVVDNTNTAHWEMSPYVLAGNAYGYKVAIARLEIDPEIATKRNVHGVPEKSIQSMARRFQDALPFWPDEHKFTNPTQSDVENFYLHYC